MQGTRQHQLQGRGQRGSVCAHHGVALVEGVGHCGNQERPSADLSMKVTSGPGTSSGHAAEEEGFGALNSGRCLPSDPSEPAAGGRSEPPGAPALPSCQARRRLQERVKATEGRERRHSRRRMTHHESQWGAEARGRRQEGAPGVDLSHMGRVPAAGDRSCLQ